METLLPHLETARLEDLRHYAVLDTPPEQSFDDLTHLAAQICGTPLAALTLIDEDRQWFKSRVGWEIEEIPREDSFCAHAILEADLFLVPDATADERFADNPFVTSQPHIRFYAGMPLVTPRGHAVGTLCVLGTAPHQLDAAQQDALHRLARQALVLLETRLSATTMTEENAPDGAKTTYSVSARLAAIVESSDDAIISKTLDGTVLTWNAGAERLYGYTALEMIGQSISTLVPADLPDEMPRLLQSVGRGETVDHYETIRVRKDGARVEISLSISPLKNANGQIVGASSIKRDITQRKQGEAALAASQQRLLLATNAAQLGVWDWDVVSNKLIWDARMSALHGIEEQDFRGTYDGWPKGLHPDDKDRPEAAIAAALNEGGELHPQFRVVWPNGEVHWIEALATAQRGEDGRVLRIIGVNWDITQRKQDEVALQHSEERYRSLAQATTQIVWTASADGLVQDLPAWRDFTGQTVEEVQGRGWIQALHPSDRERFAQTLDNCANIDIYKDECRIRGAGKNYRRFAVRGVPIREEDGSVREWVGTFTDIEDRRRAEEERDRFFTLSLDMLTIIGKDGFMKRLNPAWEAVLGFSNEELMAVPFLEWVHPDDRAATIEQDAKLIRDGQTVRGGQLMKFENRYRCRDGSYKWLLWMCTSFEDLIYCVAHDVTAMREAQAELHRSNDELETRVMERTTELATANESLRVENVQHQMTMRALRELGEELQIAKEAADAANLAKSEFLSRMSHELRTPLNAILGFGQLLESSVLTPRQHESAGYILKGGRHLLGLINEVLDIARVEAGHVDLSIEPVAIHDVVPEVCSLVRPLAEERHIRLEENISKMGRSYILADLQRLKQVLLNLFSNAIKYNREGGQVEISFVLQTDGWGAIAVRDTGPGISPQDLPKLFTPFERLGAATSGIEGTGLGLVLSQRLATAMGGALTVESLLGQGTTFTLKLPQTASPAEQVTNIPAITDFAPASDKIEHVYSVLCIEDNPSNLRLIEAILESRPGITLLSAMQGSIGLDLARQHEPDLILLDLDLPDIKGNEVLLRLQQSAVTRDIPVVIVSADATPGQIERLLAAGAKAYLTKPLDVGLFLDTVSQFLTETPATVTSEQTNENLA